MTLAFAIPDTAPFIHYDPLTRWTSAYAPAKDGRGGDETYHQAGVAMAGIDFNITGEFYDSTALLCPISSKARSYEGRLVANCSSIHFKHPDVRLAPRPRRTQHVRHLCLLPRGMRLTRQHQRLRTDLDVFAD